MEASLAQTFNETTAAAYEAFPQKLKKLVVLLTPSSDTPVYASPDVANRLSKSADALRKDVAEITEYMQAQHWVGYAGRKYNLAGTFVDLIALDKSPEGLFSRRYTKNMLSIFNLDHEIGHHILRNGCVTAKVSEALAENAADAYAMLRHIQRFGKNTDHAGGIVENRACNIVLLADSEHSTADAVEKVIRLSEEMDISGLSLRETAALAEKIADECCLDDKTLKNIRKAFKPINDSLHKRDIFKAGKRFLNTPAIKKFMTESAKTDPCWKEALSFIDNPETTVRKKSLSAKP